MRLLALSGVRGRANLAVLLPEHTQIRVGAEGREVLEPRLLRGWVCVCVCVCVCVFAMQFIDTRGARQTLYDLR